MKKLKKEDFDKIKEGMKKTVKSGHLRDFSRALQPKQYSLLATYSVWHSIKYLLIMLLIAFLVMSVISIPMLFSMPDKISAELSKFSKFNLTADVEMAEPAVFTAKSPQLVIDTTGTSEEMASEKILITKSFLAYRPYNSIVKINISELRDVTSYKDSLSNLITFIAVLIIPSILITTYILYLIKYTALIIIAALIVLIYSRMIKKDIGLRKSLITSIYASTAMFTLEVLIMPFSSDYLIPIAQIMGLNLYLIPMALFLALALFASYFAGKKPKKNDVFVNMEEI